MRYPQMAHPMSEECVRCHPELAQMAVSYAVNAERWGVVEVASLVVGLLVFGALLWWLVNVL